MKLILPLILLTAAQSAAAHEGHGDTPSMRWRIFLKAMDSWYGWLS